METHSTAQHYTENIAVSAFEPYIRSEGGTLQVAAALMRAQEKFERILKDTNNPFYKSKYATLDQVISATRPHLRTEGLVIIQENIQDGDRYGILTRLIHLESGEELVSQLVAKPKEDTIQQIAGVLTYCRRYEYHTITGTASEDDDGAAASGTDSESRKPSVSGQARPLPEQARQSQSAGPVKANIPSFASSAPTTAIAGDLAHSTASSGVLTTPVTTTSAVTSTPAIVSSDPKAIPTKEQFDAYVIKATDLAKELEDAGLKAGRGLPVKSKLGKYIRKVAKTEDLHQVMLGQWEVIFTEFEKLLKSEAGKKQAVEMVESANLKEGK